MTSDPLNAEPAAVAVAVALPVAAVVVDTGLAHLDRVFEYAVPPEMAGTVGPGARVRVRFAGRDLDGFVVELRARPTHGGRLAPLSPTIGAREAQPRNRR